MISWMNVQGDGIARLVMGIDPFARVSGRDESHLKYRTASALSTARPKINDGEDARCLHVQRGLLEGWPDFPARGFDGSAIDPAARSTRCCI